jgi:hypothetical protein
MRRHDSYSAHSALAESQNIARGTRIHAPTYHHPRLGCCGQTMVGRSHWPALSSTTSPSSQSSTRQGQMKDTTGRGPCAVRSSQRATLNSEVGSVRVAPWGRPKLYVFELVGSVDERAVVAKIAAVAGVRLAGLMHPIHEYLQQLLIHCTVLAAPASERMRQPSTAPQLEDQQQDVPGAAQAHRVSESVLHAATAGATTRKHMLILKHYKLVTARTTNSADASGSQSPDLVLIGCTCSPIGACVCDQQLQLQVCRSCNRHGCHVRVHSDWVNVQDASYEH